MAIGELLASDNILVRRMVPVPAENDPSYPTLLHSSVATAFGLPNSRRPVYAMNALSDAIAQSVTWSAWGTAQDTRGRRGTTGSALRACRSLRPRRRPCAATAATAQWIVVGVPAVNATTGPSPPSSGSGQQWEAVLDRYRPRWRELGVGVPLTVSDLTPVGTFTFDQALRSPAESGTKTPYFQATDEDWWDEDAGSPDLHSRCRDPQSSSIVENL